MKTVLSCICLMVATSALAQEERGRDLMGEALKLFMRGLMTEMEPALTDLEGLLKNFDAYHPPEILPNGDIIIRRKQKSETDTNEGEVEL